MHNIKHYKLLTFYKLLKFKLALIIILIILYAFVYIFIVFKNEKFYYVKRKKKFKHYNDSNLVTISDKINWLVIHDTNRLKGKCADKIKLHDFSKKKLGKDICNKILKIYKNAEEINLNDLPKQFVLKTNHGSNFNIIVNNKSNLNITDAKNNFKPLDFI